MPLYYKKVDANQFILTDAQKILMKERKPVHFQNAIVRHVGGENYIAVLQQGENLLKINLTQWLVKHPDGLLQILWPHEFSANFIEPKSIL